MSTPTFDGSTGQALPEAEPYRPPVAAPVNGAPAAAPVDDTLDTLLDQLREEVDQRDQQAAEPWRRQIKGTSFRIVCDPDIDYQVFKRWQKQAMAQGRKGKGAPSYADLDQFYLSTRALVHANIGLEVQRRGTADEWTMLTSPRTGETLTIDSDELLGTFNTPDPVALLRKLFGRDSAVIDAGQSLLDAAGYMGEDDEDAPDPTVSARSARRARKA